MSIYCKYLVSDFHEVYDSAEELQPGGLDLLVPSAKEKNEKMKLCCRKTYETARGRLKAFFWTWAKVSVFAQCVLFVVKWRLHCVFLCKTRWGA